MPELPEVETIRRQLEKKLVGLTISDIEVRLPKQFIGEPKEVIGKKIDGVKRRGKMLILELGNIDIDSGSLSGSGMTRLYLVVHLKLTGQLVWAKREAASAKSFGEPKEYYFPQGIPFAGNYLPGKSTHIIFTFNDGSKLFFNDNRQFGWIKIVQSSKLKVQSEKLGPEPFSKEFTVSYLEKIVDKSNKLIKVFVMEQDKIAGVGNIYANEALFVAGIDPRRKAKTLNEAEIKKLYNSIILVLTEGIKYQGSSGKDESYINADGESGHYQDHFRVYQQQGKPCPNKCGGVIRRMELGGRGTFFCPKCQK